MFFEARIWNPKHGAKIKITFLPKHGGDQKPAEFDWNLDSCQQFIIVHLALGCSRIDPTNKNKRPV